VDDDLPSGDQLATDLRRFGIGGGFREMRSTDALDRLVGLACVDARARRDGIGMDEALRAIVIECLDEQLDEGRREAMTIFLQTRVSGYGRDVGVRRERAGRMMTSRRPGGLSGRTWEREYEVPTCELVSRGLRERELAARRRPQPPPAAGREPVVLAILPFRVDPGVAVHPLVVEGFVDETLTWLARVGSLTVLSPTAVAEWAEAPQPLRAARSIAGVTVVLSGVLRRFGDELQLHVRLDDTATGAMRWADRLSFGERGLAEAQTRLAESVTSVLGMNLTTGELRSLEAGHGTDPAAHELYLRGRGLVARNTEADIAIALTLLDEAIAIDDNLAAAHAYKGYALWRRYFSGWPGQGDLLHDALDCVNAAIDRNPDSIPARLTRIRICWDLGRHEDGVRDGARAARQAPASGDAHLAFARSLNNAGLADLALPITRQVLQRNPADVTARKLLIWNTFMTGNLGTALDRGRPFLRLHPSDANTAWAVGGAALALSEHETARRIVGRGLDADPGDATLWLLAGYVERDAGDEQAAVTAWEHGREAVSARLDPSPGNARLRVWLASILACLGEARDARAEIARALAYHGENAYLNYRAAGVCAELRDTTSALKHLRRAIDGGFRSVQLLEFEQRLALDALRDHPQFARLRDTLRERVKDLHDRYAPLVDCITTN
jgi:tetratricopeptide (TPR) repeat protein